ncbi:sensor histidine kinase [Plantibacter sp. YIM 135249]|uniref:sensor histidine kinase n=1 Tax=Plantibacter sp. YIM 135249 TaxID=3423918 RepID=UPI003D34ACD1
MTDSEPRAPRRITDLRVMRGSTAATLGVAVLVGAAMQLLVGVNPPLSPRVIALVALTVAASIVALATIPLLLRAPGDPGTPGTAVPHHPLVVALVLLSLGVWVLAVVPPFAGWGWAFTLAIGGGVLTCVVRGWWKLAVVLGTYAVMALGGLLGSALTAASSITTPTTDSATDAVLIGTLVLFTLMPLSAVWVLQVVLRFEEARRMASELAVAKERLRFATDLHDIQGHHLQVIALKSELAERLMAERPDAARVEIADIRVIAQEALDDTRAVVNDYRSVTVAVEARNAAAVLRSAGIRCEARLEATELPTSVGALFAIAIREAATNVLRHSRATDASIELVRDSADAYRLTVTNNAPGPRRLGGTGLTGLAERVATQHGTVETTRTDDAFTLIVRVPVPSTDHHEEHSR